MYDDGDFEWDEEKAAQNCILHGLGFETARYVFKDTFAVDYVDDRESYGEERSVIIGIVDNRLLCVAYTMRGDRVRIISARGAEPYEKRRYHEENSY